MRAAIKPCGTLRRRHPGYRHTEGPKTDAPDSSTIAGMFSILDLPSGRQVCTFMDGRAQNAEANVEEKYE